jgi:hypothetical protein
MYVQCTHTRLRSKSPSAPGWQCDQWLNVGFVAEATRLKADSHADEKGGAYKTGGRTSPWRIPPKAIDYYQATHSNY